MSGSPRNRWRDFHIISGPAADCRRQALALLAGQPALWIGGRPPQGMSGVAPRRLATYLGQDVDHLVFDALDGLDPDALAIAAGLVRGGGRFLLLTPEREHWGKQPESRFLRRLARLCSRHRPPSPSPCQAGKGDGPGKEQELVVQALHSTAHGHRNRPLVVVADRGRGKSSAFGMAAGRLLAGGLDNILVTAPRLSAVHTLFQHAARELPDASRTRGQLQLGDRHIRFMAVDKLLEDKPDARLLLVDEAAGIPLPMLEKLLEHYRRIAFSTTVHGYEGSGRGFSLRFARVLDECCPRWKRLEMHEPVRWAADDPLEAFIFRALLLDAEPGSAEHANPDNVEITTADRDELAGDDRLLGQLFGLLVDAHYRTTPTDLKHLLDASNLSIHLARAGSVIVGALLVATEGRLPTSLHGDVLAGRRRPKGQLLPTALAVHCGFPQALQMHWERIMRIAVHPRLQGRGIGSRLLARLQEDAARRGVDMLGASFGATPKLLDFWKDSGYAPVRLGQRREASSGSQAIIMLKPVSPDAEILQKQASAAFREQFPMQLAEPFRDLDPALVTHLLENPGGKQALNRHGKQTLEAFAAGQRQYIDALGALHHLAVSAPHLHPVLVLKVLQGRSWQETAAVLGLAGKKPVLKLLREVVRHWLEA